MILGFDYAYAEPLSGTRRDPFYSICKALGLVFYAPRVKTKGVAFQLLYRDMCGNTGGMRKLNWQKYSWIALCR